MKNLSDESLRVYKSILPKISRSPFGLEISYMRILRSQKLDFEHENTLGMRTEGLHVDFDQNVNFSPCAWNWIFRGFWVSGTQFSLWKLVQITYWGSTSRFLKKSQSFHLILWLKIWGSFDIRNSLISKKFHHGWPLRAYMWILYKLPT